MILVTNDDGIHAEGLKALARALSALDEVWVVAPDRERSATGMAITLKDPVGVEQQGPPEYAVDGTPVDCVNVALGALLPETPVLLVSGINHGANLGHDVHYSGTVAAAIQGTFVSLPSIAVSLVLRGGHHFDAAAHVARRIAKAVLEQGLPPGKLLNVNVPDCPLAEMGEILWTRQDLGTYDAQAQEDENRPQHYWIAGNRQAHHDPAGTDLEVIRQRCVSVTPIQLDMTDHEMLSKLELLL